MPGTARLVTAEELERMPDDPLNRFELVEGRLVRMSRSASTMAGSSSG